MRVIRSSGNSARSAATSSDGGRPTGERRSSNSLTSQSEDRDVRDIFELLEAVVLSAGFDTRSEGLGGSLSRDSQSGATDGDMSRGGTVPTIVPEARKSSASRANASQFAQSRKQRIVKDLRKTKVVRGRTLANRLTRPSGSLRFGASSWSVGSIWGKSGPPNFHSTR
jgi:hypothetical protein